MKRAFVFRSFLFIALSSVLGCAGSMPAAQAPVGSVDLNVKEVAYGLVAPGGAAAEFTQQTNQIQCSLKSKFGAKLKVSFPPNTQRLPISAEWQQPAIAGLREETIPLFNGPINVSATSFNLDAIFDFSSEAELINGQYALHLFHSESGQSLYSRAFDVTGCRQAGIDRGLPAVSAGNPR